MSIFRNLALHLGIFLGMLAGCIGVFISLAIIYFTQASVIGTGASVWEGETGYIMIIGIISLIYSFVGMYSTTLINNHPQISVILMTFPNSIIIFFNPLYLPAAILFWIGGILIWIFSKKH